MQKNVIETITGAVVLATAAIFLVYASEHSQVEVGDGYKISASFTNATGLATGSDVRIGGVKVGVVSEMSLNPETYQAVITMELKPEIKIPADSSAAIASSGLLGDKFIALEPGGDEKMLADGGKIEFTQASVSLEEMIGKFMFSGGGVDKKDGEHEGTPSSASPDATLNP